MVQERSFLERLQGEVDGAPALPTPSPAVPQGDFLQRLQAEVDQPPSQVATQSIEPPSQAIPSQTIAPPPTQPEVRRSVFRGQPTDVRESIGSIGPALQPLQAGLEILGAEAEAFGAPVQNFLFGDINFGPEDQSIFSRVGNFFRGELDPGQSSQRIPELAEAQSFRNQEFVSGRLPFIDFVEQSNAQQEARPFVEQIGTGLVAPSNFIPLERIGGLGRVAGQALRRTPTGVVEEVAEQAVRQVDAPAQVGRIVPDAEVTAPSDALSAIMGRTPDRTPPVIRQSDQVLDDVARDALLNNEIVESVTPAGNTVISSKEGAVIRPNQGLKDSFGLPDRPVGLSRPQQLANMLAGALGPTRVGTLRRLPSFFGPGRTQTVPLIRNIMDDARDIVRQSGSLGNQARPTLTRAIDKAFTVDKKGLITDANLLGIEERLPGGITLKTLAARLPNYWNNLNNQQRQVMIRVREALEEPRRWIGKEEIPDATNIVRSTAEGVPNGFYVPSRVIDRGIDPVRPITSSVADPLASSVDEPLIFKGTPDGPRDVLTQEEAIEGFADSAGNFRQVAYAHPGDAIADAIQAWGKQASRNYTVDALTPYGLTPKQIAIKNNPELWSQIFELRGQMARLKNVLKLPQRQIDELTSFFDDPLFDDINVVFNAVDKRISRGQFQDANFDQLQELMTATREYMRPLMQQWKEAITAAGKDSDEFISIGGQRLAQRKFPIAMADAARDHLRRLAAPGQLDALNNDLNAFYTGFRATGDDSYAGIQGWLSLFDNPARWSKIFVAHYKGFFDLRYIGGYVDDYNTLAKRTVNINGLKHVLPTVEELITRAGMAFQGRTSAAAVERGVGGSLSDRVFTRGKLNPLARLNNLWSVFGDRIRMDTVRDEIMEQIGQGRAIDELWDSGDMRRIATSINRDTGFVDASFGGTAGQRVLFASKWLQSRLESTVIGAAGIRDPRIISQATGATKLMDVLSGGRFVPQATRLPLNQRQTARRFWRLMTYGTALTVGINEIAQSDLELAKKLGFEPNETYLQPRINGRLNPNFMKFRLLGRDLSFYGPFHSIYNMMHRLAMGGSPVDVISGLAAGTVSNIKDLGDIVNGGGDFRSRSDIGERAVLKVAGLVTDREFDVNSLNEQQEFSVEARAIQFGGRILENFMTFGTEEIFESGEGIAEGHSAEGVVGVGSEILGTQSTPLSPSDVADRIARENNLPHMAIAEDYQRRILNDFPEVDLRRDNFVPNLRQVRTTQVYASFDKRVEEIVLDPEDRIGPITPRQMASLYLDAEGELFNQLEVMGVFNNRFEDPFAALQNGEIVTEEDALDGWYSLRNMESSINPRRGQPGGEPLNRNRKAYLRALPDMLADSVRRNTNLRVPPDKVMLGLAAVSFNRHQLINGSIKARKEHLAEIGANPELADMLKVLP